eukprot:UN01910
MSWQSVTSNLEQIRELLDEAPEHKPLPKNVEEILEDYQQLEDEIRIELPSLTPQQRQEAVKELQGYKQAINTIKQRMLTGSSTANQNTRFNAAEADQYALSQHERNMQRLQKSREQLHQTEQISHQTIENLNQQTEQMHRINNNLQTNNQELSTSNKLLNHMNKWWRS